MLRRYTLFAARFTVGIVFIIASIDKIYSPDAFAASIHSYLLLPDWLVNITALVIPWLELLCGMSLVVGCKLRAGSFLSAVMLGVFTLAIVSALMRGLTIDCGCFGKEHASPVSWMKVLEDIGLALLSVYIFTMADREKGEPAASAALPD